MIITSTADFREAARRRLPRFLFDYADGGAGDEATLADNVADLSRIRLRQRVLRDVADIDTSTTFFGQNCRMPIGLGPIGIAGMFRRRGEVLAARAAHAAGIPFCLSTVSLCSLDEVANSAPSAPWFQLYMVKDRAFMRDLLAAAQAAGCKTLVFTVDMPVPGARRRDKRSGMSGPGASVRQAWQAITHPRWLWDVAINGRPHMLGNLEPVLGGASGIKDYMGWLANNFDPSITWSDLDWVRATWKGSLVVKGILDKEDAGEAIEIGADGIVVSNHGGRQLDGVSSSTKALPALAEAISGRVTIFADSGARSGLDVLRLLALGADGVLLGRAWLYALAAQGQQGLSSLLAMIEAELRTSMALAGVRSLSEIDQSLLN